MLRLTERKWSLFAVQDNQKEAAPPPIFPDAEALGQERQTNGKKAVSKSYRPFTVLFFLIRLSELHESAALRDVSS